jgi:hypothetical protein
MLPAGSQGKHNFAVRNVRQGRLGFTWFVMTRNHYIATSLQPIDSEPCAWHPKQMDPKAVIGTES